MRDDNAGSGRTKIVPCRNLFLVLFPVVLCSKCSSILATSAANNSRTSAGSAAVSSAAARYFDQFTGNDLPLKIIYNGVRCEWCSPSGDRHFVSTTMRRMGNILQDAIVVGYVGRQTKEKNFMAAARAAGQLDEKHYIVYDGTDGTGQKPDDELRNWCRSNIPGRFRLNMPVDAVGDVYAGLDVLVLARAIGKPVRSS